MCVRHELVHLCKLFAVVRMKFNLIVVVLLSLQNKRVRLLEVVLTTQEFHRLFEECICAVVSDPHQQAYILFVAREEDLFKVFGAVLSFLLAKHVLEHFVLQFALLDDRVKPLRLVELAAVVDRL